MNRSILKKFIILVAILIVTNIFAFGMGVKYTYSSLNDLLEVDNNGVNQLQRISFLKEYLQENYLREIDDEQLNIGQLKGMVNALEDPYSGYLTSEEFDEIMEDTSGKFYGIGVNITSKDGLLTVVSPIKDTPADRAGILPGDIIIGVDGQEIDGTDPESASRKIRGEKGTNVELTILRTDDDLTEQIILDVKRDEIQVSTVEHSLIDEAIYIRISQFNENTYEEFQEALDTITDDVKGILLDLRSNPGGLMSASTDVANELLPEGLIVYTKLKGGAVDSEIYSDSNYVDLPIVTLINGGSASASEIVAGALRDHDRTIIVGENSFGKGVVQAINRFSYGDGIKLTISEYFTPKGLTIDKVGIKPDIEVKLNNISSPIGIDNIEEDNQLQTGLNELKKLYK